ncbi:transposase [Streptomyces sp. PSKA54]|uniref:Transposase n=1 Tax=Streptomyces himalayensis subsp. aureolus TaxID=2758039 RepID=A0A7W2HJD4_9ACTN|nr:transposase [Streptomyces himalayensis subsp. aureolus]
MSELIRRHYPRLVDAVGIGPHSAAVLLTAMGDNSDRLHGEASFAALCGASPVEYSSGNRQHRRLNRGVNRLRGALQPFPTLPVTGGCPIGSLPFTAIRWCRRRLVPVRATGGGPAGTLADAGAATGADTDLQGSADPPGESSRAAVPPGLRVERSR